MAQGRVENPSVQDITIDQIRKGSRKEGGDGNFFALDVASERAFMRWAGGFRDITAARSSATRIALEDPSVSVENLRVGAAGSAEEYRDGHFVVNAIWREMPYKEVLDQYNLTRLAPQRRNQ